ncbi:ester cyclase [Candidatus Magnetoovum chiemensis]|nr:ester cyclase [Candidatus Magnetoovum chiemensis]
MKSVIKRLWDEVWSLGKIEVIGEIIESRCVHNISGFPALQGVEGLKGFVILFRSAFPDLKISVDDQIEEADKVVTRWTARGTHNGALMGIGPTGKSIVVEGITIYRFENQKGVEAWSSWDLAGLMKQIKS